MPRVARIGDTSSHGGAIVSGSPDVRANGLSVARVGDMLDCPLHGLQPLVAGSDTVRVNGLAVVRIDDHAECGAVITEGSLDVSAGD